MPEMREKDGIIYLDKPYKTTLVSWVLEHELCDSLVLDKEELIDGGYLLSSAADVKKLR
jgi:hypothetical protein